MTPATDLLVDPKWLKARLDDPFVRIVDCTMQRTPQPTGASLLVSGRNQWAAKHILGAAFLDMLQDLSAPRPGMPYNLPSEDQLTRVLSNIGVNQESTVVLYGTGYFSAVTRAWWVLRASGVDDVRILDGGLRGWDAEHYPIGRGDLTFGRGDFVARRQPSWVASKQDVLSALTNGDVCLVNALSAEQHGGYGGAHFGRPGRIPDSLNVPASSLIDQGSQRFLPASQLAGAFERAGLRSCDRIIAYCGGAVSATTLVFALALVGYDNVALYDGSLLEWAQDPAMPMIVDGTVDPPDR